MTNQNRVSHIVNEGPEPGHDKGRAGEQFSSSSHLPKKKKKKGNPLQIDA